MTDKNEEERARRRKKEGKKQALENNLAKDLEYKEKKRERQRFRDKHRNRYEDMAVIFITTFGAGYIIFFVLHSIINMFFGTALAFLGVSIGFIYPFFHAAIWIMAIYSAYRSRSVLDDLFHRFKKPG